MTDRARRPVMRGTAFAVFTVMLLAASVAAALEFPKLTGRVVDEAGVLSSGMRASLTETLRQHEEKTTNQVVVVTLNSLQGVTIEEFGYQLGRHWGIGQKGKNNGALLIVAPNERKVRIEVGYGLEGTLTDAKTKLIIENRIIPVFRAGRMGDGIVAGTNAIVGVLEGQKVATGSSRGSRQDFKELIATILGLFGFGLFFFILYEMRKEGYRSGRTNPYHHNHHHHHGSGGFGGGGFGGGGFSGGGGGFGGGGSSGGW